jgi:CheY-like chemotaxis protein
MACRLLKARRCIWRQLETTLRGTHSFLMRVVTETGCRILNICESEPEYLLLRRAFEGEPRLLLERCESGIAALNDLRERRASDLPDVVVIPWRLPMLTSREFIDEMKADERLSAIPIIVLADVSGNEASDLRDAGAACVLSKGITLDSFEATAAALLRFCLGICAKVQSS